MRTELAIAALAIGVGGVAHAQEATRDPFEPFNRAMFHFNEKLDEYALKPVALGYRAVTPHFFRTGVSNVLANLKAPVIFANDVFQAAPTRAGTTLARFGLNTTVGVAGIFDVASEVGLQKHGEDFGQTLGRWGVPPGPYLVLPLAGPTNIRDGFGRIVDVGIDPLTYARFDGDDAFRITRTVLGVVAAREAGIEGVESVYETSIDPYVTIRTTYSLLREGAIHNGQTNVKDLPDFDAIPSPSDTTPPAEPPAGAPK